jgi:4-hydroxybenzoate polyprenyltransferase
MALRIEDLRVPAWALEAWFLAVISVREVIEQVLFGRPFGLYAYFHHALFFLVALAAGILALALWTRTDIVRTARIVASGYVLVILPPLIDRFVFHRAAGYEYAMPRDFLRRAATVFWSASGAGKGIFIEAAALIVLAFVYALIKTKSAWRSAAAGLTLYVVFAVCGTPRLFLPLPRMSAPGVHASRHVIYFAFYMAVLAALGAAMFLVYRRKLSKAVVRDALSFRSAHFALMAGAGVYFNAAIRGRPLSGWIFGATAVVTAVLVWLATVLWNNAYDLEIDRTSGRDRPLVQGWATPGEYIRLGRAVALFALFASGILGAKAFAIVALALASAHVYSAPPLRWRLRLGSNVFIGWGSFLMFALGYFAGTTLKEWPLGRLPAAVSLVILAALSLGTLTKDAKDYEGDLAAGARTVFTVFGPKKGARIAAAGLFLSLLTPLLLLRGLADIAVFLTIAAAAGVAFERSRRLAVAFAAYAAAAAYTAVRMAGLFGGSL